MARAPRRSSDDLDVDQALGELARTGDRAIRNRVVERYAPLAEAISRRHSSPSTREDLRQVALVGLVKAVDRFDLEVGVPFSAFAARTIDGECKRYLRDRTWTVRPPRRAQELHLDLRRLEEQLAHRRGRTPTVEELAHAAGTTVEAVLEALEARAAHRGLSLDLSDDDQAAGDGTHRLVARPEAGYAAVEAHDEVVALLASLDDTERALIVGRFFQGRSQQDLADELGISQSYLSRVLRRVLTQLRETAAEAAIDPDP